MPATRPITRASAEDDDRQDRAEHGCHRKKAAEVFGDRVDLARIAYGLPHRGHQWRHEPGETPERGESGTRSPIRSGRGKPYSPSRQNATHVAVMPATMPINCKRLNTPRIYLRSYEKPYPTLHRLQPGNKKGKVPQVFAKHRHEARTHSGSLAGRISVLYSARDASMIRETCSDLNLKPSRIKEDLACRLATFEGCVGFGGPG